MPEGIHDNCTHGQRRPTDRTGTPEVPLLPAACVSASGTMRLCCARQGAPSGWSRPTRFSKMCIFCATCIRPESVGYKALARATSDLAAMGARPRYFLLTLALPDACTRKVAGRFPRRDGACGPAISASLLAGGDTTKYPSVVINLTVIGEVEPGRAILRSGARPGDLICVSGKLGEAELGLRLVQTGLHKKKQWKKLLKKHFYPEPRLALGQWLARQGAPPR